MLLQDLNMNCFFSALPVAPFQVGVFSAMGGTAAMAQLANANGFALMYNQIPC